MARLEAETLAADRSILRLETGNVQHAALRFYERQGLQPCAIFPPYARMPPQALSTSIFLEKHLA